MKTDYSINFSNLISEEARYQVSPGDKLEVLLNKWSPITELWTVSGNYITHGKYHLGFIFESDTLAPRFKGFIMCRLSTNCKNTLYFIGSYKNNMHYSDGVDVWELKDYGAGFYPTFNKTSEETWDQHLDWIDEVTKLSEEQKLRYDKSYADLPKLLEIYK